MTSNANARQQHSNVTRARSGRVRAASLLLATSLLAFAQSPEKSAAPLLHFRDIASQAGLTTVPHFDADKRYLIEMMGGGVALFDCDGDGKLDIVTVTDSTVGGYLNGGDPMVTLYHQDGDLHFTDVTKSAGLTTLGWGMGVAVGDYDNDGLPDIYVTGYGHNVLYHNLGGCKFEDVTEKYHLGGGGFSVGAAWADYDRDGRLDLFVSRYVNSDIRNLPQPGNAAFNYQGLPMEVPVSAGETDFLFHAKAGGGFEDVSEKAGVSNPDKRLGMGVVWADYDNDGWPDLFVTNDMGPNFLYHNKHDGTFEDLGLVTGTALSAEGRSMGNMAGDFADYDHSGWLSLVVTRYGYQPMTLYANQAGKDFADATWTSQIGKTAYSPVRWGAGWADFDNDGWPDIFVANGNVTPIVDTLPNDLKYREPIQFFRNQGDKTFAEMADAVGLNDGPLQSRRGTAFGDINNDGNVDVVVYNVGGPPSLFLNETKNANHRVLFRLVGTKSNKEAIGARVTVVTSKVSLIDEVRAGGSYLSTNDVRVHFGLDSEATMKKVQIQWPSGLKEELKNVPADAIYTIVEGQGIQNTIKLPPPGTAPAIPTFR
ncbi:MAG: CRTAC1 family protein [Candidatus Acidiferrales bacterium]